ncbi:hypothetical protein KRX57_07205 [Weeksellaceae bacterium TAE3-ERU29]|nr:hypothetical protein [Weeksellaceae bacterium TAE3-ERU29]
MKNYIIEEIDEVGEICFVFLIPYYLKIVYGQGFKGFAGNVENYNISDKDFEILYKIVDDLLESGKYGLFIFRDRPEKKAWEDYFDLLTYNEAKNIISDKKNWVYNKDSPAYYLSDIIK